MVKHGVRVVSGTTENLRTIDFVNSTTGFIGGDGGTILKTTDGGETWVDIEATLDAPYSPLCLEMINESHLDSWEVIAFCR